MKNKRKISLLLIAVLLIGLLSGCTSAEKVAAKAAESMSGKALTHAKFSMPFAMTVKGAENTDISVDLQLEGEYWESQDPAAAYMEIDYEGEFANQWFSDKMELYVTKEGDTYVIYYYSKFADTWMRIDSGMNDEAMAEANLTVSVEDIDLDTLVLAEDTVTVGGSEAYQLSYTLAGQLMQDWWDEQGGFSGMLETAMETTELDEETAAMMDMVDFSVFDALDLTVLNMPLTMYVDKSSYEIKQIDMEYKGVDALMNQMFGILMDMVAQLSGMELAELGIDPDAISVEIPDFKISLTDMSYDPVEVKAVPEEGIIRGKQQAYEPLQEDGSYVLQEYGNAVRIVPQEDREVAYAAYNMLELTGLKGGTQTVYTMLDNSWSDSGFMAYVESNLEAIQVERPNAKIIDEEYEGYTVKGIKFGNIVIYYAWKPVGDGWLLVETFNIYTQLDYQILWPALEAVNDYTLS